MDDIELLEMAAKAAGYQVEWVKNSGCLYRCEEEVGREQFDSLDDDGDALRLAADIGLDIMWLTSQQSVCASRRGIGEIIGWLDDSGRAGALRRAITVAAAKIGAKEAA